jgi:hypothetical protein
MSTVDQPALVIPEQVYPGLRPFRRDESILFFGRQDHVDELLVRLEDTAFLAVVGLSGGGKSSLVLAGLLPALERGHLGGVGPLWQVAELRPGSDPLGALAAALDGELGASPGRAAQLRSGRMGLVEAAEAGRKQSANLLVVVDQFEELFRFQRSFENKSHEAAEFVRLLLAATSDYRARLYVVITMRSDYLGECARFPGLAEALNSSQYLPPRLTRQQLREAMIGAPALRNVTVEPKWLESVLDQTAENRDQLPVLQHLLRQMWNREGRGSEIGEADFCAVGGLNALNEHADAVYRTVSNQELARRVFQCLTETAEPSRENRRFRKIQELMDETASDFSAVKDVVDHFREEGCNFLSPPKDKELTPDTVIDITHEALIRGWTKLKEWARKDADSGEWYRRVEDRLRTSEGTTHLESPELEAAIEARKHGGWNAAWAKRYAGKNPKDYGKVVYWLEASQRESSKRARRRLWILAGIAIGLALLATGAVWAAVAINQNLELARQEKARADEAKKLLGASNEALENIRRQLLAQNGWTEDRLRLAGTDPKLVNEGLAAGQALLKLSGSSANILIQYHAKPDEPANALVQNWRLLGYTVERLPPMNEVVADVLWFRGTVPVIDLKRIALTMIRAGLQVRAIRHLEGAGTTKAEVGYDPEFSDLPPWSVDEIVHQASFDEPRIGSGKAYVEVRFPSDSELTAVNDYLISHAIPHKVTLKNGRVSTISTNIADEEQAALLYDQMRAAGLRCALMRP